MSLFKNLLLISVVATLFNSCGSDSAAVAPGTGTTYDNAMVNSTSTVNTNVSKLASLMADSESALIASEALSPMATTWWDTNTTMNNDVTNSGQVTPKSWMGTQLNENATRTNGSSINVFGRLKSTLGVFCVIGIALDTADIDANGYPDNGSHTVSLTSALASASSSNCKFDIADEVPFDVTVVVSDAGGAIYDKKFVISPPNGGTQTMYVKVTETETKIISVETSTQNSINYFYRTIVDISNGAMRVEYISGASDETDVATNGSGTSSPAVAYFHRLYYKAADSIGVVGSFIWGNDNVDNAYLLSGDPTISSPSLSLTFYSKDTNGDAYNKVCVNGGTGAMSNENNHCGGSDLANLALPSNTAAGLRSAWGGGGGAGGAFYDGANFETPSNTSAFTFTDETDFKSGTFSQN